LAGHDERGWLHEWALELGCKCAPRPEAVKAGCRWFSVCHSWNLCNAETQTKYTHTIATYTPKKRARRAERERARQRKRTTARQGDRATEKERRRKREQKSEQKSEQKREIKGERERERELERERKVREREIEM